jgi:uncharacterized protein (TIGR02594 family)
MKFVINTFTDLLESPSAGAKPKLPLSPNDQAFDNGVDLVAGFRQVIAKHTIGWLADGTYEPAERETLDPEVFVRQCLIVERTINNLPQTKPWFVLADYLIARALMEKNPLENCGPQLSGSDATGPLQVSPGEWKKFIADGNELQVGYGLHDYDDYLMQVWGAGFTAYTDSKAITKAKQDSGVGSDVDPPLPSYLELYLTYLTSSAKAAVALANAAATAQDEGQEVDAGAQENPDKNVKLNTFLKDKCGLSDTDIAALFKSRSKLTGTNDANSKAVNEFVSAVTAALNAALTEAFALIKKHSPESLFPVGSGKAPWFDVAKAEKARGVKEPDPRILEYFNAIHFDTNTTKTPWCAAFVSFCMLKSDNQKVAASVPNQAPARAATWRNWGETLPPNSPDIPPGAVVVLSPTEKNDSSGHVSFFVKGNKDTVTLLGGNQSDAVKESTYSRSRVVAVRWMNLDQAASRPVGAASMNLSSIPEDRRQFAELIAERFGSAGFGIKHQICAVANAMRESSLNPRARTITSKEDSVGLFQLNRTKGLGRGHDLEDLLDPVRNTDIIIAECKKFPQFGRATTLEDAISIFVRFIERPANQTAEIADRLAKAKLLARPRNN